MAVKVGNIVLDRENVEFNNAAEFVQHTDKLVYLTGKAGTGKTTFLKYIKETTKKNTVILAPTGVAAINAGGVTIHSFFQIPFGPFVPNDSRLRMSPAGDQNKETIFTTFKYREDKQKIIGNLELLIIDEISMVRADLLDVIDKILKVFRRKHNIPFGGVQVILIGDTFQLPPIADNEQWGILSQFYQTPFFFSSKVIEHNTPLYIELKKIYRQNEQEFIDLLNRVRISQVTQNDLDLLNSKYNPTFSENGRDYIILATHNKIVNETNLTKLNLLETELFTYRANITGTFPDKNHPTDHYLKLKVGCQIMFIKNDTGEDKRYYNGKIGKIKELEESTITVVFDDESEVEVERTEWNNIQYSYDDAKKKVVEEIIGTFEQFPIRLAWAITVHKSQGLTFEKVFADLNRAFAPGQVYVALSRCTSFNGLKLKTQLTNYAIKTDPRVIEFAKNETPGTLVAEQLNAGKADFYYKKARDKFTEGEFSSSFNFFKRALKFRNDVETEIFQKFIEVQGNRLYSYKEKYLATREMGQSVEEELKAISAKMDSKNIEISEKANLIKEQNSAIELLLKRTKEFEDESSLLKKELKRAKENLATSVNRINGLEAKFKDTESELHESRNKEKFYKAEVDRMKGLKWYDKLFGKN